MQQTRNILVAFFVLVACSCTPLHDLDKAASNQGGSNGAGGSDSDTGANGTGGMSGGGGGGSMVWPIEAAVDSPKDEAASGGRTDSASGGAGVGGASNGGASGGAIGPADALAGTGGVPAAGGAGGGASDGGCPGTAGPPAADLPDIYNSPVDGKIIFSAGASWDIDGAQWPAFEIHTPTANYWLVKSAAAIVSITDTSQLQWINFSSGFRPNRGVPNLGGCCEPGNPSKLGLPTMTTDLDPTFTITSTHLRLISKSQDESYVLVWDFFLTHFTLTVNRAAKPFGFTYEGVPGGNFGPTDQLVLSSGAAKPAASSYSGDLPGPAEWAYLSHPAAKQSLFLIQHSDDSLAETYRIADGDTGMFTFGGAQQCRTPVRFSLGVVDSCDDQAVRDRIAFVIGAIH
jgi:hypothetical protein